MRPGEPRHLDKCYFGWVCEDISRWDEHLNEQIERINVGGPHLSLDRLNRIEFSLWTPKSPTALFGLRLGLSLPALLLLESLHLDCDCTTGPAECSAAHYRSWAFSVIASVCANSLKLISLPVHQLAPCFCNTLSRYTPRLARGSVEGDA